MNFSRELLRGFNLRIAFYLEYFLTWIMGKIVYRIFMTFALT